MPATPSEAPPYTMTNAAASPELYDLALRGDSEELERTWNESVASPGPVVDYIPTLEVLVETNRRSLAANAGVALAKALHGAGRSAEAVDVLVRMAYWKIEQVDGAEALSAAALEAAYGSESWLDYLLGKAGIARGSEIGWDKWREVAACLGFAPGRAVEHRSGWGAGRIDELDVDADEVRIAFASGRQHTVPWQTAMDTMNQLAAEDLRAMRLEDDKDAIFAYAKERPTVVLRRAIRIYRGKATSTQIKEQLHESIVPAKSWTSWWKKAKAAAVEDPLIAVEGSASRPTLTLRKKALTLTDEARAQLKFEKLASKIVAGLRAFYERATRDSDRDALGEYARERLGVLAMNAEGVESAHAIMFLEEIGQLSVEDAAPMIRPLLGIEHEGDFETHEVQLEVFSEIDDPSIRSRLASQLPSVLGPKWVDAALAKLPILSEYGDGCEETLEILVEHLRESDVPDRIVELYNRVAPFPTKHPFLIYLLTKAHAEGALAASEQQIESNVLCRVILHALRIVCEQHTGRRHTRLQSRIQTLLSGRKGMLAGLLGEIDRNTMASAIKSARAGGEDFPAKVQELIETTARERFPDFFEEVELMFWEDDYDIYVSRKGFEHRESEFHHLRDDLIPANSKAIGEAASLGDLSENAEWEAAMEEQRNLTARASEWEDELSRARLIEEVEVPDGIVAPGTVVKVHDLDKNEGKSYRILGPWDAHLGDDVVSYRAPLAKGMLGSEVGNEVEIQLPGGVVRLRVDEIAKIF